MYVSSIKYSGFYFLSLVHLYVQTLWCKEQYSQLHFIFVLFYSGHVSPELCVYNMYFVCDIASSLYSCSRIVVSPAESVVILILVDGCCPQLVGCAK